MSPDLTFYTEKGSREADAHPTDLVGTSRNYRGQKTTKNYSYTWIPGCKEIITKTYEELAKIKYGITLSRLVRYLLMHVRRTSRKTIYWRCALYARIYGILQPI
ncbi:hypothetical protein TNCT_250521 [Trichonephila clavata]|uniref:Uncharacterized protein n=1 Tax=Trichonephila clavata TaxID=2740835 RepID=A0A8X6KDH9_TRICU|nr:hypothetical protein TNCT_250521 [Trichonephila clavata]